MRARMTNSGYTRPPAITLAVTKHFSPLTRFFIVVTSMGFTELHQEWDWRIIAISYVIAAYCSMCAISLVEQERWDIEALKKGRVGKARYIQVAMFLGGGIFCMHFTGMSALTLKHGDHKMQCQYDVLISISSLVVAVLFTYIGLRIASNDVFYKAHQEERIKHVTKTIAKTASLSEIRKNGSALISQFILLHEPGHLLVGGLVTGSAVVGMHYVGMFAMHMPGKIVWDAGIVVASWVVGCVVATVAFFIIFRALVWRPNSQLFRAASAMVMGAAVCGMHYTGMAAARYRMDEDEWEEHADMPRMGMGLMEALLLCAIVTWLGSMSLYSTLTQTRSSALRLAHYLHEGSTSEPESCRNRASDMGSRMSTTTLKMPPRLTQQSLSMIEMERGDDVETNALAQALSNPQARSILTTFMAQERSTENIKFLSTYRDTDLYVQRNSLSEPVQAQTCLSMIQNLYRMYLVAGAPLEVNLSARNRETIREGVKQWLGERTGDKPTRDECVTALTLIQPAYQEIFDLVLSNSWPRFCITAEYKKVQELLRSNASSNSSSSRRTSPHSLSGFSPHDEL